MRTRSRAFEIEQSAWVNCASRHRKHFDGCGTFTLEPAHHLFVAVAEGSLCSGVPETGLGARSSLGALELCRRSPAAVPILPCCRSALDAYLQISKIAGRCIQCGCARTAG